jgi:hypothetical protein
LSWERKSTPNDKTTFAIKVDAAGNRYVAQTVDKMDKNHRENCDRNATIGEGRMYENPQSIHFFC